MARPYPANGARRWRRERSCPELFGRTHTSSHRWCIGHTHRARKGPVPFLAIVGELDRVEFGVERKSIVSYVNGVDLRDILVDVDEWYAMARAEDALFGIPADAGFPRGLFHGDPGYATSPFDGRVRVVAALYDDVTTEVNVRIAVGRSVVEWSDFDNFRAAGYPWHEFKLGPYVFDRAQYDEAVNAVAQQFGPPPGSRAADNRGALSGRRRLRHLPGRRSR
jgi:hypothetical protein